MNALLNWWKEASAEDKKNLAAATDSTVAALHQMAHAYRTSGQASLSPEMARKIEIGLDGDVLREDLCLACRGCELAEIARKCLED